MYNGYYELHTAYDADFPLRFHLDEQKKSKPFNAHWHEHIELLYITDGVCRINGNGVTDSLKSGDTVFFSPNCVHTIEAETDVCKYYCITVDKQFCDNFGIPVGTSQFSFICSDEVSEYFKRIIELMENTPPYYREEVKAILLRIIIMCYRGYEALGGNTNSANTRNRMVAEAIDYISSHLKEQISIEELCKHVGFTKFYFCRKFKEVTGKTVVEYINLMRCINAKRLIKSGQYNISECAELSGFSNLSYFTKTYRKHMGKKPSEEM